MENEDIKKYSPLELIEAVNKEEIPRFTTLLHCPSGRMCYVRINRTIIWCDNSELIPSSIFTQSYKNNYFTVVDPYLEPMTFDDARHLANQTGYKNLFKHEDMPEAHNIYGVLKWLHENRNIECINKMLDEKKWIVIQDKK